MEILKRPIDSKMYLQNSSSTPLQRSSDQRERMTKRRKKKLDELSRNKDKSSKNSTFSSSIMSSIIENMSSTQRHPDKKFIRSFISNRSAFLFLLLYTICVSIPLTSSIKISNALEKKNSLSFYSSSSSSSLLSNPHISLPTSSSSSSTSSAKLSVTESDSGSMLEKVVSSLTFTKLEYQASIPENSLGKIYVVPTAESERMGISFVNETVAKKVNVKFKIKGGDPDDMFKAESELVGDFVFLMIRIKTSNKVHLNRERKSHYTLEIVSRVKEKGQGKKRRLRSPLAKTIVKLRVTDTNDLDPFFQSSTYTFNVPEDTALHTSIGRVAAEDADEGINGEIYYSIIRHSASSSSSYNERVSNHENKDADDHIFAVDPVSGVLSLTRPLNFRHKSQHQLTIVAQDRGPKSTFTTRHADTATVDIFVKQVNILDYIEICLYLQVCLNSDKYLALYLFCCSY